jgi:PAS domain S-box-containing protein
MIWTTEATGRVNYVGPEWTVFTGQPAEDALGKGWLWMLHPEDRKAACQCVRDACDTNASFTMQYRLRRADGSYARIVSGAAPSFSPVDGRFLGYLGSCTEIGDAVHQLHARREIGNLVLPRPLSSTMPLTAIDIIADYVLLARATSERAGERELYACLDLALTMIHTRLGGSRQTH